MKKERINIPQEDLRRRLFDEGASIGEIADDFNCSKRTVQKRMQEYGLRLWPREYDLDVDKLVEMYKSGMTLHEIEAAVGASYLTVYVRIRDRVNMRPDAKRKGLYTGENSAVWKGGRIERGGYWAVRVGEEYVMEHRLVMEEMIGRQLTEEEVVHHINRKRKDNDPTNLLLLESNTEHQQLHAAMRLHPGLDQRAWVAQYRIENAALAA